MAPGRATEDMFAGDSNLSQKGGLAVGVPGEMKGLWTLYTEIGGGVPWSSLLEPTIQLCEQGFLVDATLASALRVIIQFTLHQVLSCLIF